jgi:hypothetical protein
MPTISFNPIQKIEAPGYFMVNEHGHFNKVLPSNHTEQCGERFEDNDGMGVFICDRPKGHGGLHESASWQRAGEVPLRTQVIIEEQK